MDLLNIVLILKKIEMTWNNNNLKTITVTVRALLLTLSSLLVRLLVSAFWLASSSLILLHLNKNIKNRGGKYDIAWNTSSVMLDNGFFIQNSYPLSRFKSNRCPAVTLSISYLHHNPEQCNIKIITWQMKIIVD